MSDDPEWDEAAKQLAGATERMMKAGWISETMQDAGGLGIQYTDKGLEHIEGLRKSLEELDLETMTRDDLFALRAILLMEGDSLS